MIAELTLSGIAENVITAGIVGGITSAVVVAILRQQMAALSKSVADLTKDVGRAHERISQVQVARTDCELRAAHQFATRGEIAHLLTQTGERQEALLKRMDQGFGELHSRVTALATKVAAATATEDRQ